MVFITRPKISFCYAVSLSLAFSTMMSDSKMIVTKDESSKNRETRRKVASMHGQAHGFYHAALCSSFPFKRRIVELGLKLGIRTFKVNKVKIVVTEVIFIIASLSLSLKVLFPALTNPWFH